MDKKNTEISERIAQVIDFYKTNSNNFAKVLGYSRSQAVYDMLSGKAKPSFDFFNRFVCSEFSERINLSWLIAGVGEMNKTNNTDECTVVYKSDPRDVELIAANRETIETQRKLIASLESRISELEKSSSSKRSTTGLHSALTVDSHSTDYSGNETK